MRERIRGYADAQAETADAATLGALAGEVEAVQALLNSSDDLRRTLADPGVPAPARRAVLVDLLGEHVEARTLTLLAYPIDVDRATEYPGDVAWLALRIRAAAGDETAAGDVVLGRLAALERVAGYADALLEDVEGATVLDDMEDELFRFMRIVDGADELQSALTSSDVPASARRALVVGLLDGKARPQTIRLAAYATGVGRPRDYLSPLNALVERVAAERNRRLAEVVSAVELDEDQRERLAEALSHVSGRPTEIRVTVDPAILGGFVATMGDTIVDGSVRHRLDLLKDRLSLAAPTLGPDATTTTTSPSTGESS
jgi:F-type H+-transporting ATPase subunit delta